MSLNLWHRRIASVKQETIRPYSAWILCALLVVLCTNAKLARYDLHARSPKLATNQAYLDAGETSRTLPRVSPPRLWGLGGIALAALAGSHAILSTDVSSIGAPFVGFDTESHLRAPPTP